MTTTPRITFSNGRYLIDGKSFVRVSDILAVINKPGLNAWRTKVGNEEADKISRTATDLGSAVHAGCEALNRALLAGKVLADIPVDASPLSAFLAAYRRFLDARVKRVLLVEHKVFHEAGQYAGTLDFAAELVTGEIALLDLKTGKTVDHVTTPLQLAAYSIAAAQMGDLQPVRRLVVHLPSNQPGKVYEHDFSDAERFDLGWWAALRLYRHTEANKDGWKFGRGVER